MAYGGLFRDLPRSWSIVLDYEFRHWPHFIHQDARLQPEEVPSPSNAKGFSCE